MTIPNQAEPVNRSGIAAAQQPQGSITPQACWCVDPAPGLPGHTWWCEVDRELMDTGIDCTP